MQKLSSPRLLTSPPFISHETERCVHTSARSVAQPVSHRSEASLEAPTQPPSPAPNPPAPLLPDRRLPPMFLACPAYALPLWAVHSV